LLKDEYSLAIKTTYDDSMRYVLKYDIKAAIENGKEVNWNYLE
jgi:hypothetical protein